MILLIEQLGLEGYGIFWVLIEILREQPGYRYPLAAVPALARRYVTSKEKVEAVIRSYGLFRIVDDEFFLSDSLCRRMEMAEKRRKKLSEAGKKGNRQRWHQQGLPSPPDRHPIARRSPPDRNIKEKNTTYSYSNTFSNFYKNELSKSGEDPDYAKFLQVLYAKKSDGSPSGERPLENVLRMPQQLTWIEFQRLMYFKRKYNIQIAEILRDMNNNRKLKDRVNLWRTFQTYMKNAHPETRNK